MSSYNPNQPFMRPGGGSSMQPPGMNRGPPPLGSSVPSGYGAPIGGGSSSFSINPQPVNASYTPGVGYGLPAPGSSIPAGPGAGSSFSSPAFPPSGSSFSGPGSLPAFSRPSPMGGAGGSISSPPSAMPPRLPNSGGGSVSIPLNNLPARAAPSAESVAASNEAARQAVDTLISKLDDSLRTEKKTALDEFESFYMKNKPILPADEVRKLFLGNTKGKGTGLIEACGSEGTFPKSGLRMSSIKALGLLTRILDPLCFDGNSLSQIFLSVDREIFKQMKLHKHLEHKEGSRLHVTTIVRLLVSRFGRAWVEQEIVKGKCDEEMLKPPPTAPDNKKGASSAASGAGGSSAIKQPNAVFGCTWKDLYLIGELCDGVPNVLRYCMEFIRESGALQIPGLFRTSGEASEIDIMKNMFDSGMPVDLSQFSPHSIAGLCKTFLRTMPEPIFGFENYDSIVNMGRSEQYAQVTQLIKNMPMHLRCTLIYLLDFFAKMLAVSAGGNGLSETALATLMTPNLLRPRVEVFEKIATETQYGIKVLQQLMTQRMKELEAAGGVDAARLPPPAIFRPLMMLQKQEREFYRSQTYAARVSTLVTLDSSAFMQNSVVGLPQHLMQLLGQPQQQNQGNQPQQPQQPQPNQPFGRPMGAPGSMSRPAGFPSTSGPVSAFPTPGMMGNQPRRLSNSSISSASSYSMNNMFAGTTPGGQPPPLPTNDNNPNIWNPNQNSSPNQNMPPPINKPVAPVEDDVPPPPPEEPEAEQPAPKKFGGFNYLTGITLPVKGGAEKDNNQNANQPPSGQPGMMSPPGQNQQGQGPAGPSAVGDWVRFLDPSTKKYYWYNNATKETSWLPPASANLPQVRGRGSFSIVQPQGPAKPPPTLPNSPPNLPNSPPGAGGQWNPNGGGPAPWQNQGQNPNQPQGNSPPGQNNGPSASPFGPRNPGGVSSPSQGGAPPPLPGMGPGAGGDNSFAARKNFAHPINTSAAGPQGADPRSPPAGHFGQDAGNPLTSPRPGMKPAMGFPTPQAQPQQPPANPNLPSKPVPGLPTPGANPPLPSPAPGSAYPQQLSSPVSPSTFSTHESIYPDHLPDDPTGCGKDAGFAKREASTIHRPQFAPRRNARAPFSIVLGKSGRPRIPGRRIQFNFNNFSFVEPIYDEDFADHPEEELVNSVSLPSGASFGGLDDQEEEKIVEETFNDEEPEDEVELDGLSAEQEWEEYVEDRTGRKYYHNPKTGVTVWDNPLAALPPPPTVQPRKKRSSIVGANELMTIEADSSVQYAPSSVMAGWHQYSAASYWKPPSASSVYSDDGVGSCGGVYPNFPTWSHNPQFQVAVQTDNASPVIIEVTWERLERFDNMAADTSQEKVGFYVFENRGPSFQKLYVNKEEIVGRSDFDNSGKVSCQLTFQPFTPIFSAKNCQETKNPSDYPAHYTIVVSTFHPGHQGRFNLTVHSQEILYMRELIEKERWHESSARGEWRGKTAGGCKNHKTFSQNPHYHLIPPARVTSQIFLVLSQSVTGNLVAIGFYVLNNQGKMVGKGAFQMTPEVHAELEVRSSDGPYTIVPCTFTPGLSAPYTLTVFSKTPVLIKEVEK